MEIHNRKLVKRVGYHEWKIEDFTPLIDVSDLIEGKPTFLESLSFSVDDTVKNSWCLRLGFTGERPGSKEWVSISLATTSDTEPVRAMGSLFILNNRKEKKFTQCFNNIDKSCNIAWYSKKFLEIKRMLDNKEEFLPNNQLTIGTEVVIYDFTLAPIGVQVSSKPAKHSIYDDLNQLLVNKLGSDVTLVVGNKEFKAHKSILMARCPEFFRMFTINELNRINESKIVIPKMDPKIFEMILEFIYTDKVSDVENNVVMLLEVANKYQLQPLKELCQELLLKSLDIDNAIQIMDLAYRSNAQQLLELATELIINNITRVMKTQIYSEVSNSNPFISSILVERLASMIPAAGSL
ncbi:TD and POZ domain-containing protein 1-like [Microplitis demolitor]|uniref:TD and POZ domain-containing protein 1-like n=1 Tax=Microplitis demolitor TaxID=69319 RepID=UPI0004CDAC5C|nr:TD and POZ domain-containing protein 1-like [Microplitis demolitor]XP_014295414.1 TD and POZ domain-containing protein 1-like [Microplitis demolitor]